MTGLAEIVGDAQARTPPNSPFTPPHTTFNIGRIDGGNAVNIIPEECVMQWEFRPVSRDDSKDVIDRFEALCGKIETEERARVEGVTIRTEMTAGVPPCEPQENSSAEALVKRFLGTNRSEAVSFGTEAALFQEKGMSVVVCGPGSMDQAHQANEFVTKGQLDKCEAFIDKLFQWAMSGG